MYKEYREMSRTDAVEALYQDMAARHRSRFRSIHVWLPFPPPPFIQHRPIPVCSLDPALDPQGRRDLEDGRRPTSIYQAAPYQEAEVPTTASRPESHFEETFCTSPTFNICIVELSRKLVVVSMCVAVKEMYASYQS